MNWAIAFHDFVDVHDPQQRVLAILDVWFKVV